MVGGAEGCSQFEIVQVGKKYWLLKLNYHRVNQEIPTGINLWYTKIHKGNQEQEIGIGLNG
jgi:hypothetical protein